MYCVAEVGYCVRVWIWLGKGGVLVSWVEYGFFHLSGWVGDVEKVVVRVRR